MWGSAGPVATIQPYPVRECQRAAAVVGVALVCCLPRVTRFMWIRVVEPCELLHEAVPHPSTESVSPQAPKAPGLERALLDLIEKAGCWHGERLVGQKDVSGSR